LHRDNNHGNYIFIKPNGARDKGLRMPVGEVKLPSAQTNKQIGDALTIKKL